MAESLTESFCERCGTRYTFEAAIPKKHRIGRLKVLSKGLKNYVLSEDASLDEALAEARSEEERELSGGQLDAFHQTFQFCMSCRQYTCANCWNEAEGRCLSCAPLSLVGTSLRSPLDDLLAGGGMAPFALPAPVEEIPTTAAALEANGHVTFDGQATNGSAWPTIDLFRTPGEHPATEMPAPAEPPPAAIEEPEAALQAPVIEAPSPTAETAVEAPAAAETIAPATAEAEPATDFWTRPFTGFAPQAEPTNGYHVEPTIEPAAAAEEAEPAALAEPEARAEPIAEPEPVAVAEPEPEPEPVAVAEPVVEAGPAAVAALAADPEPAAESVTTEAPSASLPVEPAVEPIAAEAPEVAPIAPAQAPDPEAEVRAAELAAELAGRTSRLLGRFRVQPRSAGATAGEQAAAADAAAARELAAAAAATAPAIIQPLVVAEPEPAAPIVTAAPAQPSWMFVVPAPEPEPAPEPALQAWPEPVVWGQWKSEAMIAGALESPALTQDPAAPALSEDAAEPLVAAEPEVDEPSEAAVPDEPVAAEVAPAPPSTAAEPAPPPPAAAAAIDRIEMPAWPTLARPHLSDSAPVLPQPVLPPAPPPVQAPAQAPQWPAPLRPDLDASSTPFWASGEAGRTAGELDVWDASAREVTSAPGVTASPVGVQSCVSCGLSLSATARFCRRCGSRQG